MDSEELIKFIETGEYKGALAYYQETMSLLLEDGLDLLNSQKYHEAIDEFNRVLEILREGGHDYYHDKVLYQIAVCWYHLGNYKEAISASERATKNLPGFKEAWHLLGMSWMEVGQYQKALQSFEQVLRSDGTYIPAYLDRAVALYNLEDYNGAIDSYKKALKIEPNNQECWEKASLMLYLTERSKEALEFNDGALSIDPNNSETWSLRGQILFDLHENEEALKAYNQSLKINPNDLDTCFFKSQVCSILEEYQESLDCCNKVLESIPDHYDAWYIKAGNLFFLEKYENALDCCHTILEVKPDSAETWYLKGDIYKKLQQYQNSVESFEKCLELEPDNQSAFKNKKFALALLKAQAEREDAIRLRGDDKTEKKADNNSWIYLLLIAIPLALLGYCSIQSRNRTPSTPSVPSSPVVNLSYQATCGSPPGSGSQWYAVVGDRQAYNIVKDRYCADSFIRKDGNVQTASFTSTQEAEQFAVALTNATGYRFWVQPSKGF